MIVELCESHLHFITFYFFLMDEDENSEDLYPFHPAPLHEWKPSSEFSFESNFVFVFATSTAKKVNKKTIECLFVSVLAAAKSEGIAEHSKTENSTLENGKIWINTIENKCLTWAKTFASPQSWIWARRNPDFVMCQRDLSSNIDMGNFCEIQS